MADAVIAKSYDINTALSILGARLRSGVDSSLLVWVINGQLACAFAPLRPHHEFSGPGEHLAKSATAEVVKWADRIKGSGIKSIICLLHPREMEHYNLLDLGADDLIEFYRRSGFEVCHIPWGDPDHWQESEKVSFREELARVRVEALNAFDSLPKPVLIDCGAAIDRTSYIASYIATQRTPKPQSEKSKSRRPASRARRK